MVVVVVAPDVVVDCTFSRRTRQEECVPRLLSSKLCADTSTKYAEDHNEILGEFFHLPGSVERIVLKPHIRPKMRRTYHPRESGCALWATKLCVNKDINQIDVIPLCAHTYEAGALRSGRTSLCVYCAARE